MIVLFLSSSLKEAKEIALCSFNVNIMFAGNYTFLLWSKNKAHKRTKAIVCGFFRVKDKKLLTTKFLLLLLQRPKQAFINGGFFFLEFGVKKILYNGGLFFVSVCLAF